MIGQWFGVFFASTFINGGSVGRWMTFMANLGPPARCPFSPIQRKRDGSDGGMGPHATRLQFPKCRFGTGIYATIAASTKQWV